MRETSKQLESCNTKLDVLDFQEGQNKVWVQRLIQQIHHMSNGSGITNFPFHIQNPTSVLKGSSSIVVITTCLICGFHFSCNNILVASCGCTYHSWCLGVHLESCSVTCVSLACGIELSSKWLTNVGFKQINMHMQRPKIKGGMTRRGQSASRSTQASIATKSKFTFM